MSVRRFAACAVAGAIAVAAWLAGAPAAAATATSPDGLDRYLQEQVDRNGLPGLAVAVVRNGRVVHVRGFGTADGRRPVTGQTPFVLASVSKPITATAVMQLVEAGQVSLDAPVQRYLPQFELADHAAATQITVRQLLTHTSGLPDSACQREGPTLEGFVAGLRSVHLQASPGTRHLYCSGNYNVLGLLVEKVSGESFGDYVHDHVFAPLGMLHSYTTAEAARRNGLAQGHQWLFGLLASTSHYNPSGLPSGYLVSSAEDMARFAIAQLAGGRYQDSRILSAASTEQMHRPAVDVGSGTSYGLGWQQGRIGDVPAVYHYGANYDTETLLLLEPGQQAGVVLLVNAQGLLATSAFRSMEAGVARMVAGLPPDPPGSSVPALYGIADAVLAVLSTLALLPLLRLPRWRRRLLRVRARTIVRIAVELVAPVVALVLTWLVGRLIGARPLQLFMLVPDLVGWLWGVGLVLGVAGVARVAVIARSRSRTGNRTQAGPTGSHLPATLPG